LLCNFSVGKSRKFPPYTPPEIFGLSLGGNQKLLLVERGSPTGIFD
jgi:hypothetical protein